jgi:hypothetical protein
MEERAASRAAREAVTKKDQPPDLISTVSGRSALAAQPLTD